MSKLHTKMIRKSNSFLYFHSIPFFENCWRAALDLLAGRVFEVPALEVQLDADRKSSRDLPQLNLGLKNMKS